MNKSKWLRAKNSAAPVQPSRELLFAETVFPHMLKMRCLALALGLSTAGLCQHAEDLDERKAADIDKLVARYQKYGYLNGALLVADRGNVIYSKGVGEANFELRKLNTPQTKFAIASLTKQFTAVLILQQVEEGRLRLEGKISDYLTWYRNDTGKRPLASLARQKAHRCSFEPLVTRELPSHYA